MERQRDRQGERWRNRYAKGEVEEITEGARKRGN